MLLITINNNKKGKHTPSNHGYSQITQTISCSILTITVQTSDRDEKKLP